MILTEITIVAIILTIKKRVVFWGRDWKNCSEFSNLAVGLPEGVLSTSRAKFGNNKKNKKLNGIIINDSIYLSVIKLFLKINKLYFIFRLKQSFL